MLPFYLQTHPMRVQMKRECKSSHRHRTSSFLFFVLLFLSPSLHPQHLMIILPDFCFPLNKICCTFRIWETSLLLLLRNTALLGNVLFFSVFSLYVGWRVPQFTHTYTPTQIKCREIINSHLLLTEIRPTGIRRPSAVQLLRFGFTVQLTRDRLAYTGSMTTMVP